MPLTASQTPIGRAVVPLAGLVCLTAYTAMAVLDRQHDTLRAGITPQTVGWFFVAFVGFMVALWWNERRPFEPRWLWVGAIAFRLILLATEPTLSDDVYRYLWDGHLLSEGVNPYSYPIDDASLDRYEIPARALANNRDLASPYLPTAQVVFGAVAVVLPSVPLSMQLAMTGFDLVAATLLGHLLSLAELPRHRLMIYLWNPLVIVETAHGAHLDALMVMLCVAALVTGLRQSSTASTTRLGAFTSPTLLALATLTRPVPLLLTPVLSTRWRWPGRLGFVVVSVVPVLAFGTGPAGLGLSGEPTGRGVFGSARVFERQFRFNAVGYRWIEEDIAPGIARLGGVDRRVVTSAIIGAFMVSVLVAVAWAASRHPAETTADRIRRSVRLAVIPLGAFIVATPVFHPWYLLLLLALLPVLAPTPDEHRARWLYLAPWLYLAASSSLSYLTYLDPDAFAELDWVRRVEWYPTLGLLGCIAVRFIWTTWRSSTPRPDVVTTATVIAGRDTGD